MICPACGEDAREARWARLPDVPGYTGVFRLSHRRRDGKRCVAHRGEPQNTCAAGAAVAILDGSSSHSDRAPTRAMAERS